MNEGGEGVSETRQFKKLARKYRFKYRATENQFVFVANNTDGEPTDWITLDKTNLMFHHTWHLSTAGNTDQNNLWFYQTRKDLTPKKIVSFIKSLSLLLNYNLKVYMLIDPEDWQQIAKMNDAYDDVRYTMGEKSRCMADMWRCKTQAKPQCGVDKCECVEVTA
jgi:hypothetical protein|tara:strand:- start:494 stop:985 length:492 start_codon:yes stop_codon:yes gene_type:complete